MAEAFLGFTCMQQQLTRTDGETVAADSAHKLRAYFILCDAWDGLNVYARFDRAGLDPFDIKLEDGFVTVPHEVMNGAGSFDIALFGEDAEGMRLTSTRVTVPVLRSVDYGEKPPIPSDPEDPTPSLLQTIEAKAAAAQDAADQAAAAADRAANEAAATVEIGSVTSGETASVTNSGDFHNAVFDFILPKGEKGDPGANGSDGMSVTHSWNDTTLTVTSASGTSSADLKGEKGDPGANGSDGMSVTHSWNDTTLTVTSASGTSSADLKGEKGERGIQGFRGEPGVSCEHEWNGTTLTITSASGSSSADLKGEKGDKGDKGDTGERGEKGDTGEVDYSSLNDYLPLSGGAMTGALDFTGSSQVIDFGTTGYFRGMTSSGNRFDFFALVNSSTFRVGGSYPNLALLGKGARPTYNGSDVALVSDVPASTENWTFTLEDGSTVTKAVYVK